MNRLKSYILLLLNIIVWMLVLFICITALLFKLIYNFFKRIFVKA